MITYLEFIALYTLLAALMSLVHVAACATHFCQYVPVEAVQQSKLSQNM